MSKPIYDFGVETGNTRHDERITLMWPVAVWSCLIPDSLNPNINILEQLVLSLAEINVPDIKNVLCTNIGLTKELVESAIESCHKKEYFDDIKFKKRELKLTKSGKAVLNNIKNPYEMDMEIIKSDNNRKIYMFQDLVTKSVIPCFDITKLPSFYLEDDSAICIKCNHYNGQKPSVASIITAIKYWSRILNNERQGLSEGKNTINTSTKQKDTEFDEELDEFIPFDEEEVDWKSVGKDDDSEKVKTLADAEADKKNDVEKITNITIFDDKPETYYAKAYLAINRDDPQEAIVLSPFGSRLDDWFRTIINRIRINDDKFEEELQSFLEVKSEELKEKIAFNNEFNINLFERIPIICNNSQYSDLKKAIILLSKSKERVCQGEEEEAATFATNMRTALEILFRKIFRDNSYLLDAKKEIYKLYKNSYSLAYEKYTNNIKNLVNSYDFLSDDIIRQCSSNGIFKNVMDTNEKKGYLSGYIPIILLDANHNKSGSSMNLLRDYPELPLTVLGSMRLSGNVAVHGGKGYSELAFNGVEATKLYKEYEQIVTAMFGHYMEV